MPKLTMTTHQNNINLYSSGILIFIKRLSLKTQLKIEFLPRQNSGKKGLEKSLDFDETWLPFLTKLSAFWQKFCYKIVVQSPQGL